MSWTFRRLKKRGSKHIKSWLSKGVKDHGHTHDHSLEMGAFKRTAELVEGGTISHEDGEAIALTIILAMAASGKSGLSDKETKQLSELSVGIMDKLVEEYGLDGVMLFGGAMAGTVLAMALDSHDNTSSTSHKRPDDWKRDFEVA